MRELMVVFGRLQGEAVSGISQGSEITEAEIIRQLEGLFDVELVGAARRSALSAAQYVGDALGEAVINEEAQRWVTGYTFGLIRDLTDTTREVVRAALADYITTPGMTTGQVEERLVAAFGQARADNIAVTEITRASSEGTNIAKRELAQDGMDMERVWHTLGDTKVDPDCDAVNGLPESEWVDRYPDGPPAHPRCRCDVALRLRE